MIKLYDDQKQKLNELWQSLQNNNKVLFQAQTGCGKTVIQQFAEAALQTAVVRQVAETVAKDEIPVFDAGFKIRELQAAELPRYVVRLAKNFTARRNALPPYKGHGRRAEYGELVRPLARTRKGKYIPATPPDRVKTWAENGIEFRAEF